MNKIWNYKGKCFPFDITEDTCYSLVKSGIENLQRTLQARGDNQLPYSVCKDVDKFFDTVFGSGAGQTICGKQSGADEHITAYVSFISFLCSQVDEFSRLRISPEVAV